MNEWKLIYNHWNAGDQKAREALCTLANGYWATRGAAEEATQHDPHYPGTSVAGAYDRIEKMIAGEPTAHENSVNWPNWLFHTFTMENGSWFSVDHIQVRTYRQELDLQKGVLTRTIHFVEPEGRETTVQSMRLVHRQQVQPGALRWSFYPHNWSGRIQVRTELDAGIINQNVARYRDERKTLSGS